MGLPQMKIPQTKSASNAIILDEFSTGTKIHFKKQTPTSRWRAGSNNRKRSNGKLKSVKIIKLIFYSLKSEKLRVISNGS
jgi:hypothetical protein